jgi:hypothetical protein
VSRSSSPDPHPHASDAPHDPDATHEPRDAHVCDHDLEHACSHDHAHDSLPARLEHLAHFLPAQAPLARFVHHNTLHAYESLPFLEAVTKAAKDLHAEPFLEEERYEEAVASGRIRRVDLEAALRELVREEDAGDRSRDLPSRRELRLRRLLHPVPRAECDAVDWLLSESDLLTHLRPELTDEARTLLRSEANGDVPALLGALWRRCLVLARSRRLTPPTQSISRRLTPPTQSISRRMTTPTQSISRRMTPPTQSTSRQLTPPTRSRSRKNVPSARPVRLRDRLLAATGLDADERAHELLVRFVAAYLDQGVAYWPMPDRDGLWSTFRRVHGAGAHAPWASSLPHELASTRDAEAQLHHELAQAQIAPEDVDAWLHETLQALPGWAGMVHQLQTRPDLAPGDVPPVSLLDFVAIRALLDRLAALDVARRAGLPAHDLAALIAHLETRPIAPPDPRGLALELFVAAQRSGLGPNALAAATSANRFTDEVARFDSVARRMTYHLAYEHELRVRTLDALVARTTRRTPEPEAPLAQMIFCIDEREESFRRHLEEVEPRIVTYGYAGNFDVLMSYEGFGAPHPVPLCPPVVTPRHRVRELPRGEVGRARANALAAQRHVASRTLVRGGFVALTGITRTVPLVLRTLFPGRAERLASLPSRMLARDVPTELALTRADDAGPAADGLYDGYTVDEQAAIVGGVLRAIGLVRGFSTGSAGSAADFAPGSAGSAADFAPGSAGSAADFAPVVIVVGHGSSSVNNPHAAAYNCGACAGGRGGPNARALAQMANHPEVRRKLAETGLTIPDTTTFVGAYHDTATDAFESYDVDRLPEPTRAHLATLDAVLARACALDAHERCRRFPDAPLDLSPKQALRHAQARAVDLAQPRPEYCHATNAIAIVGRRSLSRGLFLDRRAFLISYDPTLDDAKSSTLERLLAQVGPVGAGINLEYFFSRVDQARHGSGTKLPHNISGLLGVMDGHGSDLRTGLHWQTVELHEPVRLLLVVESTPDALLAIAERNEGVRRLVVGRWVLLAALDPSTGRAHFLEHDGFRPHAVGQPPPHVPDSGALYRGRRDHLPFATIGDAATIDEAPRSATIGDARIAGAEVSR